MTVKYKTGTAITSVRYWVLLVNQVSQTGTTLNVDTLVTPAWHGAGFRFSTNVPDTTWQAVTCNGTTQSVTDTGITVSTNTKYILEIDFANFSTNVVFRINGNVVATITGNLPAATDILAPILHVQSILGGGTARSFRAARWTIVGQTS